MAAVLAVGLNTGTAHADDDSLLSLLGTPSITLACFPSGQVGQGNDFTGTQTVNCSQSATTSSPTGNGITGYEVVSGGSVSGPSFTISRDIDCPAGKKALDGGATVTSGDRLGLDVRESGPSSDGTTRHVTVANTSGNQVEVAFFAICANAGS
ncbi:hypothetical protein [Streptomyces sp. NPDC041003]|uniref:hypothetical protein n=1 Tax=Streptomyces sp. NPDC041003 TaxID=3155730 RepID=UPI00341168BC